MAEARKIVVIAEKTSMSAHGELDSKRRTAVFNETTTLKEVLDWARERNDSIASMLGQWANARITISEDEISNPKPQRSDPFSLFGETEEAA